MSLFENNDYRWRETCFVMFSAESRPALSRVREQLTGKFELGESNENELGQLETLTLFSPNDFSAMDICYVDGADVTEQMEELVKDLERNLVDDEELAKLKDISKCDARLDVLHFERVMEPIGGEEEFLDPGSLLLVLQDLAYLCEGIGVDPQSGAIL